MLNCDIFLRGGGGGWIEGWDTWREREKEEEADGEKILAYRGVQ